MSGLYDLSEKRKVDECVTIYKLTSEEKLQEQGLFYPTNDASFTKMNVICLMQLGEYTVVTKSYNHEFLKSNSVTNFSQNNVVDIL